MTQNTAGGATRKDEDLAQAVVDGPDGVHAVTLPPERYAALRLKRQHREVFWCSTQAAGCGGQLRVVAGPVLRPHFRHRSGSRCPLARDGARAERSYDHLHYQRALAAWLEKQGLHARIEHRIGADSRADLHVVVEGRSHTLEVQLSPISGTEWAERDQKYRSHVDHATWLYGAAAETAAATEQAERGHALHLRRDPEGPQRTGGHDQAGFVASGVEVGVVSQLGTAWSPLTACELRPDGFWTPGLRQALADLAGAEASAAALAAAEAAAAEASREEAERRAAAARVRSSTERLASPLPAGNRGEGYGTPAWWSRIYPELAGWTPAQGWEWAKGLDEQSQDVARTLCYLVQRLYFSGPISMLMIPDEVTASPVVAALERAEFIELFERNGVRRWQRAEP